MSPATPTKADLERALATGSPFDAYCGLELTELTEDHVRARLRVAPHHHQPTGVVHGGVYASVGEAVASLGTNWHVTPLGRVAFGMSNHTSFLRPVREGSLHAVGRPRDRGATTWVWDVDLRDDAGRLCATSRVTLAVRPAQPSAAGGGQSSEPRRSDGATR
jgi:uncharacterized protein (TIGR00369 family)